MTTPDHAYPPADTRPPHINPDPLLTYDQSGEYLNTGARYVRRLVHEGRIEYVRIQGQVRIRRSVLDAYLTAQTRPATGTDPTRKDPGRRARVEAMTAAKAAHDRTAGAVPTGRAAR